MSYVVTDIDKYLKGNKYDFYQLITKGWGAKDKDVIEIKNLWQEAEDATGTNAKIDKFKKLQDKLNPFFDRAKSRLAKDEETLKENDALSFPDPMDQADHDFDKSLVKFADWPKADKFQNLSLEDANGDEDGGKPYDVEQMTRLAESYGYDYRNPEERKEFLSYVSKAVQNKELDKIWNEKSLGGVLVNIATPTTKEYARQNYENINGVKDLAPALAADVGVNTLMAVSPAKIGKVPVGANIWAAPVARQAAEYKLNNKELTQAVKDAANEGMTNIATPFALRGMYRWGDRTISSFGNKAKNAAQDKINQMADKAFETQQKLKAGVPYAEVHYTYSTPKPVKLKNGVVKPEANTKLTKEFDKIEYKKLDKNGNPVTITEEEYLNSPTRITSKELEEYGKYAPVLRSKGNAGTKTIAVENIYTPPRKETISEAMATANEAGRDPVDILDPADYETLFKTKPMESKWNWGTRAFNNSDLVRAGKDYLTNLQGRSKYAGTAIGQLGQFIPPQIMEIKPDFMSPKPKVDPNDPEVKLYKRLYKLHLDNKELIGEPKKPEKLKNFTIQEIFGGE